MMAILISLQIAGGLLGQAADTPPDAGPALTEPAAEGIKVTSEDHTAKAGALPAHFEDVRDMESPMRGLIDTLEKQDLQKAIDLVREKFVDHDALNETELARAALEGILTRLSPGVQIASTQRDLPAAPVRPLLSAKLGEGVLILRPGSLDEVALQKMATLLAEAQADETRSLVLDLRGIPPEEPLANAAELVKFFTKKGSLLFQMTNEEGSRAELFTASRDPIFLKPVVAVVDASTRGAGEVVTALLRHYCDALVTGVRSGGEAVLYEDFLIHPERMLRIAVAEIKLPEGAGRIFPGGLEPDVKIDFPDESARNAALDVLEKKGLAAVVTEKERPRLNEAALVAGYNPELERFREDPIPVEIPVIDIVLQRAVDLATTLGTLKVP